MTDARVTVHREADIGRIAPGVHGHFAEHLGRCIYEGVWVGEGDDRGTDRGYRAETLDLLADLGLEVLRWPGGCFADDYHWEDGVGPREERPRRRNMFWNQGPAGVPEEPNDFGTDEFLQFCEAVGAEPYLAANVGSGSPAEAADWVEYCNYDGDTDLADRRAANGHPDPYGVTYWGLGNENWGCGGRMSPEDYAREFRRFATFVGGTTQAMLDDPLELVACGFHEPEWNRRFMEEVVDVPVGGGVPLDHLSVHAYYGNGFSVADGDHEDYDRLLADALELDEHLSTAAAAIDAVASTRDVGIVVDEWGAWHPEATVENGLEQPGTVLDALSAAAVLDVFHAHADVVAMANIAQTVNVLQCVVETDADDAWPTPTYRVFDLYAPHRGNEAVETSVDAPVRTVESRNGDDERDLPLVGTSASVGDGETFVTATNLDTRAEQTVAVDVAGAPVEGADVEAEVLFADHDPDATVGPESADAFEASALDVAVADGAVVADLPPAAVAAITVA